MFFGAGNVIFPLMMGVSSGEFFSFGLLGLIITAVGGPLLGLLSSILFRGETRDFFCRTGKIPGLFLIYLVLALIGPFAGLPRCVIVSYSAMSSLLPHIGLPLFAVAFCGLALLACLKHSQTLNILGYILSPVLLICLGAIILQGWLSPGDILPTTLTPKETFSMGLLTGYDTLDLVAALFFGPTIWHLLRVQLQEEKHVDPPAPKLFRAATLSACIGGGLLSLVYLGLSFAANHQGAVLGGVPPAELMSVLAYQTLGPIGGALANLAIGMACFTTVIALIISVVQVIRKEIPKPWLTENKLTWGTICVTAVFAMLGFDSLMYLIHPVVAFVYPAIIAMTLCNIAYKLWGWPMVKVPFYATLAATFLWTLL